MFVLFVLLICIIRRNSWSPSHGVCWYLRSSDGRPPSMTLDCWSRQREIRVHRAPHEPLKWPVTNHIWAFWEDDEAFVRQSSKGCSRMNQMRAKSEINVQNFHPFGPIRRIEGSTGESTILLSVQTIHRWQMKTDDGRYKRNRGPHISFLATRVSLCSSISLSRIQQSVEMARVIRGSGGKRSNWPPCCICWSSWPCKALPLSVWNILQRSGWRNLWEEFPYFRASPM